MDRDPSTVTLQDVADLAGVSRGTASRALRDAGRMSDATRERVQEAARSLAYVANPTARGLRTSKSGIVGLYVPDQTLSFRYYMDVAFGAVSEAQTSGRLVTLLPTALAPGAAVIAHLDGFIVMDPVDGDPVLTRILHSGKPVVSGEDAPAALPAPWATVYGDHRAGIRLLLDHVWERGARRPASMMPTAAMAWGREMADGYEQWCAEHGVRPQRLLSWFDTTPEGVRASLDELLAGPDRPDAIIAAPEGMALHALEAIRAAGLVAGDDVLLASYVDSDGLETTEPSITALDLRPRDMGARCAALLSEAIDGADRGRREEVPMVLVERRSTAGRAARPA